MAENTIDNLSIEITASAKNLASVLNSLASGLEKVRDAASRVSDSMRDMAKTARDAGTETQRAGTQSGRAATKIRRAGKDAKKAGDDAKKGASGISVFWNALKRVGSISFNGIKGLLFDFPRYFGGKLLDNVKKAVGGIGQFFGSIKRIAFYRAIRSALKLITQGFSEGIKNLYAWSAAMNGSFAASMDRLATSSLYLKNSLGAMASPLIETFAPAIDFVVDKIVDLFNIINQVIARLTGQSSYTAAKKYSTVWDDSAKKASGSVKKSANEIKRTLLGFDEINKLNDNNTRAGSGSGGAGSTGIDASKMFETRAIDGSITSFVDSIKQAFIHGDWLNLGKMLGEKVNSLVDMIDFAPAGKKVGKAINGWFTTKYWTLETINFTGIGGKIAEFLNNAIKNINFKTVGALLVQRLSIIGDLVIGFFINFDWKQAANALSHFVIGLYTEITKWFNSRDWEQIGSIVYTKLKDFLTNIKWEEIAESMGSALESAIRAMINTGKGFLSSFWRDVGDWWSKNVKGQDFATAIDNIINALSSGFIGALLTGNFAFKSIITPIANAIVGPKAWAKMVSKGKKLLEYVVMGWKAAANLPDFISYIFVSVFNDSDKWWANVVKWWNEVVNTTDIKAVTINVFNTVKEWWDQIVKWWDEFTSGKFLGIQIKLGPGSGVAAAAISENFGEKFAKETQGSIQSFLDDNPVSIEVDAVPGVGMYSKFGGLAVNLAEQKSETIMFNATTPWWQRGVSFLKWAGLDNLKTTITFSASTGALSGLKKREKGGVFSGGHWSNIPQYAGGTSNVRTGSLFWAGENGNSEIVGNAGGRTEVLNKSQIASAMYSAVQAAMAPAAANFAAAAENMGVAETGFDFETLADMVRQGVEQAMSRSNDYDRQKVELLRSINDKDFNVDVSTSSINRAQQRMNRRAGVTIAPVGT